MWAYVSVAFNSIGTPVDDETLFSGLGFYIWIGAFWALPCLLAVWAALASQSLTIRLPRVVGLAALLGLMHTWGKIRNTQAQDVDVDSVLVVLLLTSLQAIALVPLRRRYGWHVISDETGYSTEQFQYGLSRLLIWITAIAVLCGLANWIVGDWNRVTESLRNADWLGATIGVLIVGLLTLPLVIPSVPLILGDGRRRRFAVWLSVTAGLVIIAVYLLFIVTARAAGAPFADALFGSLAVVPILFGFLFALLGSLFVMRISGFRLARRTTLRTATPA
jgi:hypothetical protein